MARWWIVVSLVFLRFAGPGRGNREKEVGGGIAAGSADPNPIASAFARGEINAMIGYCSSARRMAENVAEIATVRVPEPFAVVADYGLAPKTFDQPAAVALAFAILSPEGQATLERFGFAPVGLVAKPR